MIHVIQDVLIPPRKPLKGESLSEEGNPLLFTEEDAASVLTIEELIARLEPFMEKHGDPEDEW